MDLQIIDGATNSEIAAWIETNVLASKLGAEAHGARIAVPGGSTPFPIFEELVQRDLDLSRLMVWPTDDRVVPEDHAASNTGKIRAIFEPHGAQVIALSDGPMPTLAAHWDLVWLGMGADGHVASLFPNIAPEVYTKGLVQRVTPDPLPPEAPFDRITLTLSSLAACEHMILVMRGDEKRAVFEAAKSGEGDLPIARLMRMMLSNHASKLTVFT